jgi:acetyl esterase/lipase
MKRYKLNPIGALLLPRIVARRNELGLDRTRVALMGEGAGGGHATVLAIAARDRGELPIVFQMLIYAMLDDRTGASLPIPAYMGTFVWTPAANPAGWTALLGHTPGGSVTPVDAAPVAVRDTL